MIWEDVFNTMYFLLNGAQFIFHFLSERRKKALMVWVNVLHSMTGSDTYYKINTFVP